MMSHPVKALWDKLGFVNMGYTNKIWLIDWRLHTAFGHSFSPHAQGRAQLPLTQKGNQGTVVSPYPQEFLFFKATLLQESHNSLC